MSRSRRSVKKSVPREETEDFNDEESPNQEESSDQEQQVDEEVTAKKSRSSKGSAASLRKTPKGPEANQDGEYKIDRIIDMQIHRNGTREFLVKWSGYSVHESTWEPEDSLEGTYVLEKFLKKVEKLKEVSQKQLRVVRVPTDRYTLMPHANRIRHSKRNDGKQRVKYHDAE